MLCKVTVKQEPDSNVVFDNGDILDSERYALIRMCIYDSSLKG
jgi:hypothetical protein